MNRIFGGVIVSYSLFLTILLTCVKSFLSSQGAPDCSLFCPFAISTIWITWPQENQTHRDGSVLNGFGFLFMPPSDFSQSCFGYLILFYLELTKV